jgi:SCY1-like protein 1
MRVCLLDNLPLIIDRISQKDVNGKIWPPMTTGFTDTAPVVREQTVKAVLTVIAKLSDRTINGELLRFLAKTANDDQPGIRTNTTICLGKIARNLGAGSRAKVLTAAFTRSLRDPFVHARSAALMALNATIDVFSEDDCATKVLPALCPSLVDREKIVRDQAYKTFDTFLQKVRKYAATLPETALPPETANPAGVATARIGNQNDTSWAGWAISSFTNKITTAKGEMATSSNETSSTNQQTQSLPPSGRATQTIQVSSSRPTGAQSRPSTATSTSQAPRSVPEPEESIEADFDGGSDTFDASAWGTMDDDEDSFFDAPSTTTKPKSSTTTTSTAVAFDDGGEPDFAGWLAAQSKSKAKPLSSKQTPEGLTKSTVNGSGSGGGLAPRPTTVRSSSAGPTPSTAGAKAAARTAAKTTIAAGTTKKETVKAKAPDHEDDDWGAAWD